MEKILITGASGFIGSSLVERALADGMETWAAMRANSSRKFLNDSRTRFLTLDFSDQQTLTRQLQEFAGEHGPFDYVIHAAGATKCRTEADFTEANAAVTGRLAMALLLSGALRKDGRFVFISSLSAYGPIHEQDGLPITEEDVPAPDTAYARSKLLAEKYLSDLKDLDYVTLRPTGVYGPRERDYYILAQTVKRGIDVAAGRRPQALTFIYVDDLVDAAFLSLRKGAPRRAYLLTDGAEYDSRDFGRLVQEELKIKRVVRLTVPLWLLRAVCACGGAVARLTGNIPTLNLDKFRIMRQRNWRADITPAREELGFEPKFKLATGVHYTIAWYRRNGWL